MAGSFDIIVLWQHLTKEKRQALGGIWTHDLYLTKVTLYQAELPRLVSIAFGKPYNNYWDMIARFNYAFQLTQHWRAGVVEPGQIG
jgi:hypothetical protein